MRDLGILEEIWNGLDEGLILEDLSIFLHWIVTKSRRYAFSHLFQGMPDPDPRPHRETCLKGLLGKPVRKIVPELLGSGDTLRESTGISCLNSALPVPEDAVEGNAVEPFLERARRMKTCFIGHFPDADRWRREGYPVDVIELFPEPGDIHWNDSHAALAAAELVFITGLTLTNGTFPEVIRRTPNARHRVLMGPTVPLSPVFFAHGIDLVGSSVILDIRRALDWCRWGAGSCIFEPEGVIRRVNLFRDPGLREAVTGGEASRKAV
ncbi:MAG: hypothetical protein IT574_03635 [Candidatus Aureabacteria bacterium]|nr:hypothetical protein [Candidatus Auribacterota bacterium]NLW94517.1 hypothetical protein [Chlamydiota bacterium]HOE26432.1 DUF364 domain-containing protein [bacterium]